ncbi:MAG: toxin-activating lysine-acyltransferase [Gammaproteobacteria bacterium]|nr:toxin-activating lysine-acyltransferase [Gammaproteobacteria bacterium]MBU0788065.1 toxin-activating lysine-acyltransferase [Gammaproteobacteria bacterium]MBU0815437.1 toxin-activating lysine-acyltransferase [Gammaproteobacteria bacterium]MBU1785455.1 toxin-activating lysine-acyltransferase [Gammaproteobacteria bacterium]
MKNSSFKIYAPAFDMPVHSDAEAFGVATWLWMHAKNHREVPLLALDHMLLPAINLRQYVLVLEEAQHGTRPIGYLSWANLSAEAESRYLNNPLKGLSNQDWNSGDRMWCIDFFAPFGHSRQVLALCKPFFSKASARYMYHRSHEQGVRVMTFTGPRVDPAYARQWWADRPMMAAPPTPPVVSTNGINTLASRRS